jgi:hypothetical protein
VASAIVDVMMVSNEVVRSLITLSIVRIFQNAL